MSKKTVQVAPVMPVAPKPKRVAAYARVSSGKDAMLHSLSAQVSYFSAYIQAHPSWIYAGIYADEAFTGTKSARPEFQRLLADCRAGKIDRIITKSISRFARNTVTLLETVRELKGLGISVYFEEQHIDSMGGNSELLLTILASLAQAESKSVSDNCKWRIRHDFAEGKPANLTFIYGYRIHKGIIEIHPEQAAVVRRIFSDYISGLGSAVIAARLRDEGVPTLRNGEWRANKIRVILKNEKYTGNSLLQKTFSENHLTKKKRMNRGELPKYYAEGTHPAIIEQETFDRAQAIMKSNWEKANVQKPTTARYPFTGMVVCGHCGKHYKRKTTNGRISWQCATYLQKGKRFCPAKQIPDETLQTTAADAIGSADFDSDTFNARIKQIVVSAPNELTFVFIDGREEKRAWQDRSRSESWTEEMRMEAANHARRKYQHE